MPNRGGHPSNLTVLPFDEQHLDPAIRNILAKADGGNPRRESWLRLENSSTTRPGPLSQHRDAGLQLLQSFI